MNDIDLTSVNWYLCKSDNNKLCVREEVKDYEGFTRVCHISPNSAGAYIREDEARAVAIAAVPQMMKALSIAEHILRNIEYAHPKIHNVAEVHISVGDLRRMVEALKAARGN